MDDVENTERAFNEVDRVLLTHLRCVKYISRNRLLKDFEKILNKLSETNEDQQNEDQQNDDTTKLESIISSINLRIADHGFKIDKKNDEVTGELYYIFINTAMDEVIKGSSDYSTNELNCIKSIIDEIVETPTLQYSISRINAQQKISSLLNRNLNDAHYFIMKLIDDGWFLLTKNDHLIFSIRFLSELKYYLVERFGSDDVGRILQCKQCNDIVTLGLRCPNNTCFISFHYRCLDIFDRTHQDISECIGDACNLAWDPMNLKIVGIDKSLIP